MTSDVSPFLNIEPTLQVLGVVDAAAGRLREAVLQNTLPPGTAVTEAIVAEQFGIARASAKAAIEKLTAEGLLERTAHRSARVLTIDAESVHDIYQTRRRLEGAALRDLAAQRLEPERALEANEQIKALSAEHPSEIVAYDLAFHLAIVDALDSPRMSKLYRRILSEVRLCMAQVQGRRLLHTNLIGNEHSQILNALIRGDSDGAVESLDAHLLRAELLLTDAVANVT